MTAPFAIPRIFEGETAVCVASGPSLTQEQVEYVRRMKAEGKCRIFVCNNNYLKVPEADVLFFCDKTFWVWHCSRPEFQAFKGTKITLSTEIGDPDIKVMTLGATEGLSFHQSVLRTGGNSGYMLVNAALLYGCKRVILIGYDMKPKVFEEGDPELKKLQDAGARVEKDGATGKYYVLHWFGSHPSQVNGEKEAAQWFPQVAPFFETMLPDLAAHGLEVINCTIDSAIQCFPKQSLFEVLK